MEERVQKIMARAGLGSRRKCENLIADGQVTVNGRVIRLGGRADADRDRIEVNGQVLPSQSNESIYIALNKPRGVITSLEDELQEGRQTVRDLVGVAAETHIYPVGRLDKPSEGLVLMTNDGEMAHRLTHPRYGHKKTYDVVVEGQVSDQTINRWRKGVELDGRITAPAVVEIVSRGEGECRLRMVLREGRKRQIRRMVAGAGHPVRRLVRRRIGPITLGDLKTGQWRHLTTAEVTALQKAVDRR